MAKCEKCCGNCGLCGELVLSEGEIALLQKLGQIPFLPVARRMDNPDPVYLEDDAFSAAEYTNILLCLEKRGLISIDFDQPLKGAYGKAYDPYPIRGSFALTAKGQAVLDILEIQGTDD